MTKIEELRAKHKKEIEELQDNCKHESVSGWMLECWAPGHFTGGSVKSCLECGKIIKQADNQRLEKEIIDSEISK
jgi:hypothetical protein